VGFVVLGERETSSKVRGNVDGSGSLGSGFLEVGHDGGIDGLLDGNSVGGDDVGSLLSSESSSSSETLVSVSSGEGSIGNLVNVNTGEIDLGGGGHGVNLVDALDGDTVDLVGSGDEEESGIQFLEEDDSLSTESSGEEDEDISGLEVSSQLGGVLGLGSDLTGDVVGGVPLELFDHCFRV
jgi:hypothetical protein